MGIQVHRTLLRQHAHARGHLKRLIRRQAPHPDILAQQQLLESLARVIDLQGMDEHWDREHTIEPRPKREFFPKGAYRRDALNIMRRAERPMRVAEILDALVLFCPFFADAPLNSSQAVSGKIGSMSAPSF
ncbi:hypothetical protein WG922_21690 [Ramlibacter sp. AN1015]|uniref:hypothetical protein n=1 Tax=Ramlibacter sp. AN1015 TaxID=3133428 RepID=UPI0030BF9329